jgi:DNA repair exonuclease SbcCD ATPase subunit
LDLRYDGDVNKLKQALQKLQGRVTKLDKVKQRIPDVRALQQRLTEREYKTRVGSAALEAQITSLQDDSATLETQMKSLQDRVAVCKYHANSVSVNAHWTMDRYSTFMQDQIARVTLLAKDAERSATESILARDQGITRLIDAINAMTVDVEQAQTQQE